MSTPGSTPPARPPKRTASPTPWRAWLRAVHRDTGYIAVGLTFIYALSGLAVNHIADWDPSFRSYERTHELGTLDPSPEPDEASAKRIAGQVASRLGIEGEPRDVYVAAPGQLEVVYDKVTLHVDPPSGKVLEQGQKPRFLLRVANWLHLNRGKKAWSYIADAYAVALLFLATSGMFMLKGRLGFFGRGLVLVTLGAAIPVVYVSLAGGP